MGAYALVVGETLVDLIEVDDGDGQPLYRPRFGGSPLNVAVGARRLGVHVVFVGPMADDIFGRRLRTFLTAEGVDHSHAPTTGSGTCLAVAIGHDGHISYEYFGRPESMVAIPGIDPNLVREATVLHVGSTALLSEPALSTALDALRADGPYKTLDPNPRPHLITDRPSYLGGLEEAMSLAHLVKLSDDDISYLYPGVAVERVAARIQQTGGANVIITRAKEDTFLLIDGHIARVPVAAISAADATGAGDSFMASMIAEIVSRGRPASTSAWREYADHANVAAGLTCMGVGGAEAMPTTASLQSQLQRMDDRLSPEPDLPVDRTRHPSH